MEAVPGLAAAETEVTQTEVSGIMIYPYDAADDGQLTVAKDEFVTVLSQSSPEWWYVRLAGGSGAAGYVPRGYVQLVEGQDKQAQLANSTKAAAPAQQEELEGEVHRVHPEAAQLRRALADQKLQLDTQAEQIRELDKAVAEAQRKIADTCHRAERAEARAQAAERGKLTLQKHHSEGAAVQPRPDAKEEREYMHELAEQVCSAAFDYREHIY